MNRLFFVNASTFPSLLLKAPSKLNSGLSRKTRFSSWAQHHIHSSHDFPVKPSVLFVIKPWSPRRCDLRGRNGGGGGGCGGSIGNRQWDDGNNYYRSQVNILASVVALQLAGINRSNSFPAYSHSPNSNPLQALRLCQILMAINVAMFIAQSLCGPGLLTAGAKVNSAIASGQIYRLFSPMFLHASLTHLMINSFSLHSTGPSVESWFGKQRFLCLYVISGFCGNMLSFCCTPTPSVGASGAIFGLVGASAVILARHHKLIGPRARKGLQSLAFIVLMNFGMGLSPGSRIDNYGHLGGFLGGIAYSCLFGPRLVVRKSRSGRRVLLDVPLVSLAVRDLQTRLNFLRRILR